MSQSKFIQYLAFLSPADRAAFRAFVHSPYFNKHKNTRKLLDFILGQKQLPQALDKERAFEFVFPQRAYEEQLISNLLSYLLKLLRHFHSTQRQQQDSAGLQLSLLEHALLYQNENLFTLGSKKFQQQLAQSPRQDSQHHFLQHKHRRLLDKYDIQFGKRDDGEHLEQALQDFQIFSIGENLKIACQMLARKQVTGQAYHFSFLTIMVGFVDSQKTHFAQYPSVWNYFIIYKMMTDSSPSYYFELKERLSREAKLFSHQEGRDLYTHALNYCIGQLNLGVNAFRKESFELYQQMLDNKLLFVEDQIPQWDYTNIVALGCELQEYEWVGRFIEEQKNALPSAYALNTYTYNLAAFHYSQQQYRQASELLNKVEFQDLYYQLITRLLLLKIYFEQGEWKALDYSIDNFRIFLLRTKKMEEKRRKSGRNLLRFTKQLSHMLEKRTTFSKKEFQHKLQVLKDKIAACQLLLNRSWLLQHIEKELASG